MNGEGGYEQHSDHRDSGHGHEGAEEDHQSTYNLDDDRGPAEQVCKRSAELVQNRNKPIRAARKLRVAVLDEAEADDQPERHGIPARRNWQWRNAQAAYKG